MRSHLFLALLSFSALPHTCLADTFGTGQNSFEIEFVPVGHPGNVPDDRLGIQSDDPNGAVDYFYQIGKFEISEQMVAKANTLGNLGITIDSRGPDKPATNVTWFEAALFVNWLNEDAGYPPAYNFDSAGDFQFWAPGDPGYNPNNLFRNTLARYVLPTGDEWHKAAYYNPATESYFDFPTQSDGAPVSVASGTDPGTAVYSQSSSIGPADITQAGGLSAYGTMAQGGNVGEWEESPITLTYESPNGGRGVRGGAWTSTTSSLSASNRGSGSAANSGSIVGFRVAIVPEPSSVVLMFISVGYLASQYRGK